MNSSGKVKNNQHLHNIGKSVSCDCIKANSCIDIRDIRKLDSLLNQCESISCENLLLYDEIYNYDLCKATKRKYFSTSAINKILPKNSIRRRAHKKVLQIQESDTKIIKLIDDKRKDEVEPANVCSSSCDKLTNCCDFTNVDESNSVDGLLKTQSCSNLMQHPVKINNFCDKTVQTSNIDLLNNQSGHVLNNLYNKADNRCENLIHHPSAMLANGMNSKKKSNIKRNSKQCSCRYYDNSNIICETSLTTIPKSVRESESTKITTTIAKPPLAANAVASWPTPITKKAQFVPKKSLMLSKKDKSDECKPSIGKFSRLTKQKNTTVDNDECNNNGNVIEGTNNSNNLQENRVININDKSIEIIPISLNSSLSPIPRVATKNLLHETKSDKSETQSQKSKRSKFSPSFITRKLTSRLNSEEDNAGGAKESLLGRSKSSDKKLPEPVETVCIKKHVHSSCILF